MFRLSPFESLLKPSVCYYYSVSWPLWPASCASPSLCLPSLSPSLSLTPSPPPLSARGLSLGHMLSPSRLSHIVRGFGHCVALAREHGVEPGAVQPLTNLLRDIRCTLLRCTLRTPSLYPDGIPPPDEGINESRCPLSSSHCRLPQRRMECRGLRIGPPTAAPSSSPH